MNNKRNKNKDLFDLDHDTMRFMKDIDYSVVVFSLVFSVFFGYLSYDNFVHYGVSAWTFVSGLIGSFFFILGVGYYLVFIK